MFTALLPAHIPTRSPDVFPTPTLRGEQSWKDCAPTDSSFHPWLVALPKIGGGASFDHGFLS